ncbi:MAG: hypothetical protein KGO96_05940 [Elusimicrobia bacterium]|nr:hypothetical protein [Elusimicrobiota bacterium]MDE2236962.1 hypothetical protein [Elusimicrobiota bacterium]MDE2425431.1 hypothetical protein [Elusimicrobiota bacterium]
MEAEVIPPDRQPSRHRVRLAHVRALGVFGTLMALLTMGMAFAVGFAAFFGSTLLAAGLVWATWPLVFSPAFTAWVFGNPQPVFWKLFLLFLVAGTAAKLLRIKR